MTLFLERSWASPHFIYYMTSEIISIPTSRCHQQFSSFQSKGCCQVKVYLGLFNHKHLLYNLICLSSSYNVNHMQGSFGNNYFSRGEIQNIKFGNLHQIDVPQHLRRQGGSDCLVHGVIWFELTSSKFCDATSEMADVPLWAFHLSKGCFLTVFCLVWLNWEGVKIFKTSCVRRYVLLAVAADPAGKGYFDTSIKKPLLLKFMERKT